MTTRHPSAGFSLVELLIVVAIMGIVAALALPSFTPAIHDQLQAAAQIVAADLAYGRSLAVANNSQYRYTFDLPNNRYVLKHSGTNAALNALPATAFRSPSDPADQQIVDFDTLPRIGGQNLRLLVVTVSTAGGTAVADLEFGTLGETTRTPPTTLWLAAGAGTDTRYMPVAINPITGLATVGAMTSTAPPGAPANAGS